MKSCLWDLNYEDWFYLTHDDWALMGLEECCSNQMPNAKTISSCDYLTLSTYYGLSRAAALETKQSMYNAVYTIVLLEDEQQQSDLLNKFETDYRQFTPLGNRQNYFMSATRSLQIHILRQGGYLTVDDYLEFNRLQVIQEWAELSLDAGYPISDTNVTGPR